jgi:hypothetical protein
MENNAARATGPIEEEEAPGPAPASVSRPRPVQGQKLSGAGAGRYLETLGLGANATLDAINTAYYMCIKRFPENPTEEDEARLQEVKRAYDILRRSYQPAQVRTHSVSLSFRRKAKLPLLALVAVAMLGGLVALNWKSLRLKMIHYNQGTVMALKGHGEPYGTIVGYEAMHRFPAGNPTAAYALRLEGRDTTVWVGERLVVNGMQPLRSTSR